MCSIKLLEPLRASVSERELDADSDFVRSACAQNHNAALGYIVRGDSEGRDGLYLRQCGKGKRKECHQSKKRAHSGRGSKTLVIRHGGPLAPSAPLTRRPFVGSSTIIRHHFAASFSTLRSSTNVFLSSSRAQRRIC